MGQMMVTTTVIGFRQDGKDYGLILWEGKVLGFFPRGLSEGDEKTKDENEEPMITPPPLTASGSLTEAELRHSSGCLLRSHN